MIYFDNAATSMQKPPEVLRAITDALESFGGAGRGAHPASIMAGHAVYEARLVIAELLGAPGPERVSFAANATMALNIAIAGLLPDGGQAVTTAASHNSILRPLSRARDERKCTVDVVLHDASGALDWDAYMHSVRGSVLVVATHASNLTGDVYDVARMTQIAHEAGALFVLDAAQTAGAIPVNMSALGVDVLCFTGHKSLLGPQGTGGLCVAESTELPPLLEGGTGTHSYDDRHPLIMPEALEAGTLNAHGLAGMTAGVRCVIERTPTVIAKHELSLVTYFEARARIEVPNIHLYGGGGMGRCGIAAFNLEGIDSAYVADRLAQTWGICSRAGTHCAPLMHRTLGTEEIGAVRFSFGLYNTREEVDVAVEALKSMQ